MKGTVSLVLHPAGLSRGPVLCHFIPVFSYVSVPESGSSQVQSCRGEKPLIFCWGGREQFHASVGYRRSSRNWIPFKSMRLSNFDMFTDHPGILFRYPILLQWVWGGAWNSVFLSSFLLLFLCTLYMWNLPEQGSDPRPLQWKCGVLSSGPWGKSTNKLVERAVWLVHRLQRTKLYIDYPSNFPAALNFTFLGFWWQVVYG